MKFCIVVGSYALPEFIRLQILSLRRIFGEHALILVSDDLSQQSADVRAVAEEYGVHFICSSSHRGHFAADCGHTVNGLAFAQCEKADALIKVSQRFVLVEPVVREILENYLADPETWLLLPGKISAATIKRAESRFFASLAVNSDFVCIRTGTITPLQLKERYEARVTGRQNRHATLIEALFSELIDTHFSGHWKFAQEFTHPYPGRPKLFLRRCQCEPAEYLQAAESLGMRWNGVPLLQEWRALAGGAYRPVPVWT